MNIYDDLLTSRHPAIPVMPLNWRAREHDVSAALNLAGNTRRLP